ncbi:MAG: hypothetical protein ACYC46_09395 [Acidobacteriaceae bacterium]
MEKGIREKNWPALRPGWVTFLSHFRNDICAKGALQLHGWVNVMQGKILWIGCDTDSAIYAQKSDEKYFFSAK